jgi:hypothetical protein
LAWRTHTSMVLCEFCLNRPCQVTLKKVVGAVDTSIKLERRKQRSISAANQAIKGDRRQSKADALRFAVLPNHVRPAKHFFM